jgi:hypothetical protein
MRNDRWMNVILSYIKRPHAKQFTGGLEILLKRSLPQMVFVFKTALVMGSTQPILQIDTRLPAFSRLRNS